MLTLVTALLLAVLPAQGPTDDELRAALDALRTGKPGEAKFDASLKLLPNLIESESGLFVEGGAYLAGELKRTECVPALVKLWRRCDERAASRGTLVPNITLDSLLRLDARVPVDELLASPRRSLENQYYLLLAHDSETGRDGMTRLVDLHWLDSPAHWACACALTAAGDPRIAARLVSGWDWELDLAVCDSSDCEKPPEFSSSSVGCTLTTRWPPETDYRLVLPTADQPLLPIEFTRREIKTCHFSPRKVERRERCELRARMLGSLLRGEPEASSIRADEDVTIVWRDRASFDDELRASIADLRARLGGVATALRRNGVLDDSTALAPVRVHMRLHDLRADILMPVPEPIAIDGVTYERQ